MEESQAKLQAKLAELEKSGASGSSGSEEDKPAPMEEAVDTPAVAAEAESVPEPEPTKETEAPVVESTTEETKGKGSKTMTKSNKFNSFIPLQPQKPAQRNPWKRRPQLRVTPLLPPPPPRLATLQLHLRLQLVKPEMLLLPLLSSPPCPG